jgi:hypothetical protein
VKLHTPGKGDPFAWGTAACGQAVGKKRAKPVKNGTFTGTTITFE